MHRNLKTKDLKEIAKLANLGKVTDIKMHSEIVQNYYDEPQDYITIHMVTQKDNTSPCITYIFDSLGLVNVIIGDKKLNENDDQLKLLMQYRELIEVEDAFNSVMLKVNKKQYFHQSTFFRKITDESIQSLSQKTMDDINELNFTECDPLLREEKIRELIQLHNELKQKKDINSHILNHINEVYNSREWN